MVSHKKTQRGYAATEWAPLLSRGGVAAPSRNVPVPLKAQTGWCWSTCDDLLDQHHPVRSMRRLRDIFLDVAATPPRLRRGVACFESLAEKARFDAFVSQKG
jgi:hypothetical protein